MYDWLEDALAVSSVVVHLMELEAKLYWSTAYIQLSRLQHGIDYRLKCVNEVRKVFCEGKRFPTTHLCHASTGQSLA